MDGTVVKARTSGGISLALCLLCSFPSSAQVFPPAPRGTIEDLDDSAGSPWSSALWAAGPFTANLNAGSNVDYVWYRFIDQPAITRLGLDASELTQLQSWAEALHANAGVNGVAFGPPSSGTLATIQATALVTPRPPQPHSGGGA